MKRRDVLALALGGAAVSMLPAQARSQEGMDSLKARASAKGLLFGYAVGSSLLAEQPDLAEAVRADAAILVHEYELKRYITEKTEGVFDFSGADKVMAFAHANGQLVRGHTLCWYSGNPPWLEEALQRPRPARDAVLTSYIDRVVGRYGARMHSWDVVNEAVDPSEWNWDGMRTNNPWYRAFGEDYIDLAFHATKQRTGSVPLYLNDYSVENDVRWNEKRRTAVLKLLERLKTRNVPVDGFGIQGHLKPYRDQFSEPVFAAFLRELEGMGLRLMITELDVADVDGPADPQKRDADVAAITKSFLDVALASPAMDAVLVWGTSDRHSWLSDTPDYKWSDGTKSRVLPYDVEMKKKPMWHAIAAALDAAPVRPAHGASTP